MRRLYSIVALMMSATGIAVAQVSVDTAKVRELDQVTVKAVMPQKNAPFAVSKINGKELESFSKTGRELPFLFARTPGVMAWSENGVGTGTTYMRIRGAGDSRINVTLDGVALNSPEDQCVFWANMNSYASLLGNVQIQRGVGTSTNGDGAFGGSIALQTKAPSYDPTLEVTGSYGSYNTYNTGVNFSTGLNGIKLNQGYLVIDGAYHHTGTDGYIHGTSGNSGSYYGGITYINAGGNLKLSYKNIGNYEKTGQAWSGVTAGDDNYSLNAYDGIHSYKDMYKAGLGKFNSLYEHFNFDEDNWVMIHNADGSYKIDRYQMKDGSLWNRTTDNFHQNHNLLNLAWQIDDNWSLSTTLHYTYGHGYYDEFRPYKKLSQYGMSRTPEAGYDFGRYSDFVRQKGLRQNTYGGLVNANYKNEKWDVLFGASLQNFEGNHYGYVTYVKDDAVEVYYMKNGKYKYYDSDATKSDGQMYAKGTYHITDQWDVYGDVQYRHVGYITNGVNDRYVTPDKGYTIIKHLLNINEKYDFLNPKAGFSWHKDGHQAYISYALSHREPERNNFTDNGAYAAPKAERVHDIELGYNYAGSNWYAGANLYGMFYKNQFVQTGALSDIGENLTTNIKGSYRMGVELTAGYSPAKWVTIEGNAAISQNRIKNFDEVASVDWEDPDYIVHYDNSTLAFSPTAILNGFADFHYAGFQAVWHTGFVSRQYLDNTACKDRSLPSFSTSDLRLNYDLKVADKGLKHILFGLDFNNIFNRHYAASGWTYSSIMSHAGVVTDTKDRYYQNGYIPMAGFTCMGNITLKF